MIIYYDSDFNEPDINPIEKGSINAIGNDVRTPHSFVIKSKNFNVVDLNLKVLIPDGYWLKIRSRSGLAVKHGIFAIAGVIDNDYTGNIKVALVNMGNDDYFFEKGDKICQFILEKEHHGTFQRVDFKNSNYMQNIIEKKSLTRGEKGFGSTGK